MGVDGHDVEVDKEEDTAGDDSNDDEKGVHLSGYDGL